VDCQATHAGTVISRAEAELARVFLKVNTLSVG